MATPQLSSLRRHERTGAALVLIGTAGFAFKGVLARLVYAEGLSPVDALWTRMLLAVPLFVLVTWATEYRRPRPVAARDWASALGLGALYLVSTSSDFFAVDRLGAGVSRVVLFSFPGFILAFEGLTRIVRRQARPPARVRRRRWLAFGVAWCGLMLVGLTGPGALDRLAGDGFVWATIAAASYAVFLLRSQGLMARMGSVRFISAANLGALCLLILLGQFVPALHAPQLAGLSDTAWWWMVLMATACTVGPFLAFAEGIRRVGAAWGGLLSLVGPPLTLVAAWVVLDEGMVVAQLFGVALVLAGVASLRRRAR